MPTLYAPGATPIAVTPRGFAVLEAGASAALLVRVRGLLAEGRGLGGVIEALTGAYGSSLTAIPAFAVALVEGDGVRVAVRGDFAFDITAAASERVSGAGVTTWTERVIPGVARVTLTTSEQEAAAPAEFEITDGIVLAASIVWDAVVAVRSAPAPAPAPAAAAEPAPTPTPATAAEPAPAPATTPPPTQAVTPQSVAGETEAADTSATGLIDSSSVPSVPSVADAETLLPSDSSLHPFESAADEPASAGFDAEFGATVIRSADGPGASHSTSDVFGAPPSAPIGDHDGATISLAQARALREAGAAGAAGTGHPSSDPPRESTPSPLAPPRPPAPGRLRLSTGQVVPLDRTVVIGRRPRSTRVSGTDLPHLVAVDSPQQDISRSHVELRVEGESIVATDLRTTNGTTLLRSGVDPVRLHPGEGTIVVPGDVLDLGDGITVAIEGLS